MINEKISDAENGRETFNNNEIESNYDENDMKEMGDKNTCSPRSKSLSLNIE